MLRGLLACGPSADLPGEYAAGECDLEGRPAARRCRMSRVAAGSDIRLGKLGGCPAAVAAGSGAVASVALLRPRACPKAMLRRPRASATGRLSPGKKPVAGALKALLPLVSHGADAFELPSERWSSLAVPAAGFASADGVERGDAGAKLDATVAACAAAAPAACLAALPVRTGIDCMRCVSVPAFCECEPLCWGLMGEPSCVPGGSGLLLRSSAVICCVVRPWSFSTISAKCSSSTDAGTGIAPAAIGVELWDVV